MRVRDLMAVDVIVVPVSATVTEAIEILRHGRVSGAPVIDRAGSPVGIFSVKDVAFGWGQEEAERQRVFIGHHTDGSCRSVQTSRRTSESARSQS
jgi:predicted transcriptional regulator